MDNLIQTIIDSLNNIRELPISDSEKLAHTKGTLKFADILLDKEELEDAKDKWYSLLHSSWYDI